jgi:hypothetical protein
LPEAKQRLIRGGLLVVIIWLIACSGSFTVDARSTRAPIINSKRIRQPRTEKRNPNYQCIRLISIQKATRIATDFCRTPDNGAQAVYNGKFDVDVNKVRYFYYDMAYVLSRRKALRTKDISVLSLFVNSADKEVYQAIEIKWDGKLFYVPGKCLRS